MRNFENRTFFLFFGRIGPFFFFFFFYRVRYYILKLATISYYLNHIFFVFISWKAGKGGDLTHDETTIIAGALEMTEKTAKDAMQPISKAFSLDLDGTLSL